MTAAATAAGFAPETAEAGQGAVEALVGAAHEAFTTVAKGADNGNGGLSTAAVEPFAGAAVELGKEEPPPPTTELPAALAALSHDGRRPRRPKLVAPGMVAATMAAVVIALEPDADIAAKPGSPCTLR